MERITKKVLARSALVGLILTITGMALEVAKSRLFFHSAAPTLGHIVGVTLCFLVSGFAFALGFFLFAKRLPGRTTIRKALRYSATVFLAVWVSGYFAWGAIDFEGGWNLLSPPKIEAFSMAICDFLAFIAGGLTLGFMTRKEEQEAPSPIAAKLGLRIVAGALLLPALSAAIFALASLAFPSGYELSGERASLFYVFLFAPLAISGIGTALLHETMRAGPQRGVFSGSAKISLFLFFSYWVPNVTFILFFGFTWQIYALFLISVVCSLCLTIVLTEAIARASSATGARAAVES